MPLILPGNVATALGGAYEVANSCRFNDGDSAKMSKTLGTATDNKKWTVNVWVKLGQLGTNRAIWTARTGTSGAYVNCIFNTADDLNIYMTDKDGSNGADYITDRKFRDVGAWYCLTFAMDSTLGTAGDRLRVYVNGVEETSFATETNPAQNVIYPANYSGYTFVVGSRTDDSEYFDGYQAEFCMIDGQQLTPTSFGEFDEDSPTIFKPIDVSGLTFGTNGFYLDFEDSSNLGNDQNGGTDLTEANLAAADQATDTPTNNFCVMNPLDNYYASSTFSEGNCQVQTGSSNYTINTATMGLTAGKWYWECKIVADSGSGAEFQHGITDIPSTATTVQLGDTVASYSYRTDNGNKENNNSASSYGNTAAVNDIIGIALDLDNLKFYASKNGTWQNSGDPTSGATGTNAAFTVTTPASTAGGQYFPANGDGTGSAQLTYGFNFGGCPSFAISSGNADGNGYGNFEYAPPSGYLAICTKNLGSDGG